MRMAPTYKQKIIISRGDVQKIYPIIELKK